MSLPARSDLRAVKVEVSPVFVGDATAEYRRGRARCWRKHDVLVSEFYLEWNNREVDVNDACSVDDVFEPTR